jgi:hypothetical protein
MALLAAYGAGSTGFVGYRPCDTVSRTPIHRFTNRFFYHGLLDHHSLLHCGNFMLADEAGARPGPAEPKECGQFNNIVRESLARSRRRSGSRDPAAGGPASPPIIG